MRPRIALSGLLLLTIVTAAEAVEFGWQEMPDGGLEYIVQVEPTFLDAFRQEGFYSYIPDDAPKFRRITLRVGEQKLPNQGTLPPPVAAPIDTPAKANSPESVSNADKSAATNSPEHTEPAAFNDPMAKPIGGPFGSMLNRFPNSLSTPAGDKPAEQPKVSGSPTETTYQPQLDGNDLVNDTSLAEKQKNIANKAIIPTPEPRPWMPLMLTLVVLFASLGANAYLVWIHQTMRTNYRALVSQLSSEATTA